MCTPCFHKGLRVLAHVRGILSWFFTWPNSSAWCWLFGCLSAIFSRAKGALTAGCTDCRVPQACSSSPHLAEEHPWRAGHGVPWLWGEMLAAFIGNRFDVCCCKAACVSTANAKASSRQQPGSVPGWCLPSGHPTRHRVTTNSPETSPNPHRYILSLLLCPDVEIQQANEVRSPCSESHRNIGASQSSLLQVPDVSRGPVCRGLAGGHPAAPPQLLWDCQAEEDPASEQQHPVCH